MAILKVGADGKAPKGAKVGDTIQTAGGNFTITGGSSGNWTSTRTSASSSSNGSSSNGSSSNKNAYSGTGVISDYLYDPAKYNNTFNVGSSGSAPAGLPMYTTVNTAGGQYKIVPEGTYGAKRNPQSGYWSVEASQPDWLAQQEQIDPRYLANDYYTDHLSQQQSLIDQQDRAQQEALRRQTESTISSINSNIPKINQDYEGQQRAAYIQNTKAKTGMGDYLSAMGYSGGMSESTALGLQSGYENLRNTNDQQKNNALMEIQNLVAQAQATGDTNLAQLATQKYQSMLSAMQSARQQADSMAQWESDNAFRNQQYIDSREQQAWENKFAQDQFGYQQSQDAAKAQAKLGGVSARPYSAPSYLDEEEAYAPQTAPQSAPQAGKSYVNSLISRALGGTSSVAANNIIASYQSGEISKAEANKKLAPLGIQI